MLGRDIFEVNVNIPDVKIRPDLAEYNMMSFNAVAIDSIILRGSRAAAAQDSLLRKVAARTAGVPSVRKSRAYDFHADSLIISEVDVKGVLPREKELLKQRLHIKLGTKLSRSELDHIVARIYGTQAYDYVTYELLGEKEPFKLVLTCKKGPVHQFGLGVRADTEEIVSVLLNLGFNAHKLQGNSFDLTGKISANPYLRFGWSYDGPKMPTVNVAAQLRWTDMNTLNFGTNVLSLSFLHAKQEVYLSNIKWKKVDIKAGLSNDIFDVRNIKSEQIIGNYDFGQLKNDFVSVFANGRTDTFDDGYFPTRGIKAGASYSWTFAGFPYRFDNFHTIAADVKGVVSGGDVFAFLPSANARFLLGNEIPVAYFNAIGGSLAGRYVDQQLPFIGVTNLHAMENIMAMARMDFRFKFLRNHYLTGIVNYVRDGDSFKEFVASPGYFGAGLEYAFDTIFGPLKANVHWSNLTNRVGFYVSAGFNF
jgi:NTE family protein